MTDTRTNEAVRVLFLGIAALLVLALLVSAWQRRIETACRLSGGQWRDSVATTTRQTLHDGIPLAVVTPRAGCVK